jgi:L-alanine-DL-glutamate epimerase-like enolase superfamily enzyme
MKITAIKVSAVNIPTTKSYHVAVLGTIRSTESVVLEMSTDAGLFGIGETDPALMFTGESQQTVMTMLKHHLGPAVLGMDPGNISEIHARMEAICVGNPFAKAAVDLACHDLKAKAAGIPVYELLGGLKHERLPVMWSLGSDTPDSNAREAAQKAAEGYGTIGLKLGVLPPEDDIQRVAQVRKAVGDDIKIRCDANQSWTAAQAIRTIQKLAEFNVSMVEQPLSKWDLDGMAYITKTVDIPIGVDESLSSTREAVTIILINAADFFSIKTTKHGGLMNSKLIGSMAHEAGKKLFINSMIEMGISVMSGLHFAASSPGLFDIGHALNSVRRLVDDILLEPVQYQGGEIIVPQDRIGLGATLDKRKMEMYTKESFQIELNG